MKNGDNGFTLVEVMMSIAIVVTLFGSMITAFLGVKNINMLARHKMQAMQVVKAQTENLKATPFANLANSTQNNITYDAGPDGVFGNADDLRGTVTITVQDFLDLDGDGNTGENFINVDNQGGNDGVARPVRVAFTWADSVLGQARNRSVSVDTLISQ